MTINPADSAIFGAVFGTDEMRTLWSDPQRFQAMLDVEAALARVEARLGLIPASAATAISRAAKIENLDLKALGDSMRIVGYPVVGLVKGLGKAAGEEGARYAHWGATTQDIVDTGTVLQMRRGLDLVEAGLERIAIALAQKARAHRDDVMAGRTHLQHALPVTFGYKCAVWLAPLLDHLERLRQMRPRALRVSFAGAAGTLASLGTEGRAVAEALAAELGLAVPDAPWHAARDGVGEAACLLGLVCGSLAKIATDVILMMQTEVAELAEPHAPGRGSSSTMPQKRNPIASEYVLACARGVHALVPLMLGAMAQDHERATGPWQAEPLALPQIFVLSSGALDQAAAIAEGMTVDPARMRRNLDSTGGLIVAEAVMMRLAETIGRLAAHDVVHHACDEALHDRIPLAEALARDPKIAQTFDRAALDRMTDPASYLGEAGAVVARVVARAASMVRPA